jgi:hypothetical protein
VQNAIAWALRNFQVTFFVLGLLGAALSFARRPRAERSAVEELLAFFLLFGIGLGFLYNFVMHVFFGAMVARFIGWPDSPFQAEVGFASLGYAAVGLLAFRGSFGLRLAAVVGPALFSLGAAGVHVVEMITAHNFAPGNAGVAFYADLAGPAIGLLLLWLRYREVRSSRGFRERSSAARR